MNMNDMIKKLGDLIAQKQMNNIIEDVENTLGDMELLSGKELMTIVMKHDMETANKVFEIYKKNHEVNGATVSAKSTKKANPKTISTPSYYSGCGSSSGSCGPSSYYVGGYSGGCGGSSRC